ncbi:MAG: lysine--tRNA ligase [bacterium]
MATLQELRQQRIEKLNKIQAAGIAPYPSVATRTHTVEEAKENYTILSNNEQVITVTGRVMSLRGHGKTVFFDVEDFFGKLQCYAKADALGESFTSIIENLDIGDFLEATGVLFTTKLGEITLKLSAAKLLAKSLRPLPEKWHGLQDVEKRYRQRYLDFLVNKDVREKMITRNKIIRAIREYLHCQGFIEIDFPVLETEASGALAKPFKTHINAYDMDLYLRICMGELWQKRMMVGGFEKVFEIGRAFRNEGVDHQHNPEFTLLEYYWAYADYEKNMQFHEALFPHLLKTIFGKLEIEYDGKTIDFTPPYPRKSFRDLFLEHVSLDIEQFPNKESLIPELQKLKVKIEPKAGWGKLLDNAYKDLIRPKLIQPMFLIDHPLELSPLAKKKPENPLYVERFQLLINGFEISNSYTELNDPFDQEERFAEQTKLADAGDDETMQYDKDFITALEHGMPPTTGTGIGIDRLVALLTDSHSLREVIAFPLMKPSPIEQE